MNNIKKQVLEVFSSVAVLGTAFAPALAFAATPEATCSNMRNLSGLFGCFMGLVGYLIAIAILLAFFFFLWGVMKYMFKAADDEKQRTEGRNFMIWGIIAIFVMVSVWGFVQILQNSFGLGSGTPGFRTGTGGGGTSYCVQSGGSIQPDGTCVGAP